MTTSNMPEIASDTPASNAPDAAPAISDVRFWLDPICPWCWVTSQWIRRVAAARGFEVTWEPISLLVKNETTPESSFYDRVWWTYGLLRVLESVRASEGNATVGELYTEFGRRIHHEQTTMWDPAEALKTIGLDAEHAVAASAEQWDAELRRRMAEGLALVGNDVGTPIIAFTTADGREVATFGPVITKVPSPTDSLKLWDSFVTLTELDEFWELKRTRTQHPDFGEAP
ncbi:MAG: DsbA family protein [Ilumatobacteraceae bacterium]